MEMVIAMASADLLSDLGLFVRREFLAPDECATLKDQLRSSQQRQTGAVLDGSRLVVDEMTRRATEVGAPRDASAAIAARLDTLRPELAAYFGKGLTSVREPRFLAYGPADHFIFHRDRDDSPDEPQEVSARRVSVVVFVNDWIDYRGGALQFYAQDLSPDSGLPEGKVSLDPEAGTLVAFDPHARHQVQPVRSGTRFTMVTWFI
jgi:predicted 2-oxoglutarate/Fe(II)-dependent dioxygenase YbiX